MGGGCFVDNMSEGWGSLVLGVKAYLIHSGAGLIRALMCPGGRGTLTPCVSWGWRGLEKKMRPPRIISGTALWLSEKQVVDFAVSF